MYILKIEIYIKTLFLAQKSNAPKNSHFNFFLINYLDFCGIERMPCSDSVTAFYKDDKLIQNLSSFSD